MHITETDLKIVKDIIYSYLPKNTKIYVFGSRATGHNLKKYSDLDLVIDTGSEVAYSIMVNLRYDFEESDLTYKVDILDWNDISENFKENIKNDMRLIDFS